MNLTITTLDAKATNAKTDALVYFIADVKKLPSSLAALDKKYDGLISASVSHAEFKAKKCQALHVFLPTKAAAKQVFLIGTGGKKLSVQDAEELGGTAVAQANSVRAKDVTMMAEVAGSGLKDAELAARIASGATLAEWRFDKYFTTKPADEKPRLAKANVASKDASGAKKEYATLKAIADGVHFTRDLVTEPANVIYPKTLADECKKLEKLGVKVTVLNEAQMAKLGMNALLGVGLGSRKESLLVTMEYKGSTKKTDKPLAFVGKGVCFDTGGISIKPAGGMEEMKWDMGGSAVVIGLMHTLAARKAKVNAVGVVGLVENMPDGNAQRPGDVVKSADGQTIEVLNTDAEGRLVLADALWYTQDKFKPKTIIDLATLTGAIIVALGSSRAGLFSNDDKMADQLSKAGEATGEPVWRLPLGDVYDKQIDSQIADMQNIGSEREAGSITAAQFLKRFIKNNTPWTHLDIAGTAWSKKASKLGPKGATGYGVRLLNEWVSKNYEG